MSERIQVSIDSHVAHVLLNRPEKKNALDGDMFEGLREAVMSKLEKRSANFEDSAL